MKYETPQIMTLGNAKDLILGCPCGGCESCGATGRSSPTIFEDEN